MLPPQPRWLAFWLPPSQPWSPAFALQTIAPQVLLMPRQAALQEPTCLD